MHHIENLREVMGGRIMEIDEPLSPQALDRMETNRRFESPQRLVRSSPLRCPDAPRKKQRALVDDDDQIYTTSSYASVPLFPFEGIHRMNSMSSTQTVPPPMALLPKFEEPVLIESLNNEHPPILIEPDEEREPVQIEEEEEEARQEPDARQN